MNSLATGYLEHLRTLVDDPLQVARAAAAGGTRVVGYFGNDIPVALILAANALPVRLHAGPGGNTTRADQFLESAHRPELRAIAERWLAGDLDFLHTVIFPRADDSAQRLYYYLEELQRRRLCGGPRPLLHDVANIDRPSSFAHTRESTRRLARALGVNDAILARCAARAARRELLLADIRARQHGDAPLPGSLAWRACRASDCDWRETFDASTHRWLEDAPMLTGARRIVLAGDAPPDDSLHLAIEAAGGSVVEDLTESEDGDEEVHGGVDVIDALADRTHSRRAPVLAMRRQADWVAQRAARARAAGVVFWLIEEDESLPWELARQDLSLKAASVPTLRLVRQPWRTDSLALDAVREFVGRREATR